MNEPKCLLSFRLEHPDTEGADAVFTLESAGGETDTYTATGAVLSGLVRFVAGLEERVRRAEPRGVVDNLLQPPKVIDLLIDLTGESALLRAHTGQGRMVQIELSEALLTRLQERLPAVLDEIRQRRDRRH